MFPREGRAGPRRGRPAEDGEDEGRGPEFRFFVVLSNDDIYSRLNTQNTEE